MYFETAGQVNTQETIALALQAAEDNEIRHIVIASKGGDSARLLIGTDCNVVCVTHVEGFEENGKNFMDPEVRRELEAAGIQMLTTTHVLSGVERGISTKFGGIYPAEVMSHTLRMFGQGTKVCVEAAIMALDAGLVPYGERIIAIAGTGRGVDTALILTPAHAQRVFETRVHEVICKPGL